MKASIFVILGLAFSFVYGQNIGDFTSVEPVAQTDQFIIPSTHRFQKIIEVGEALTEGGVMPVRPDFTAYVPIAGSNTNGYLSINSEGITIGGVTVFDVNFNAGTKLWDITASEALDFSSVFGTIANCSGTITPWNTVISSEEIPVPLDLNTDGYNDFGWNVEVDPVTKTVISKLWAMGNFAHENVSIHSNERTVYQGADSDPGYLYKYVADVAQDLSEGVLYVYSGSKDGAGTWIQIANTSQAERNTTISLSADVGATVFEGIEDVELGPDGMLYIAAKGEGIVFRLQDSDPLTGLTATMETYAGNTSYDITHESGVTSVAWGLGNDNLAFDNQGNLWVQQDGGEDYIWVVESGHTQANPKVKLFGIGPTGSETTGITFTPDNKYMFLSIQHPSSSNNAQQLDAEGNTLNFDKGTSLVIALADNLGTGPLSVSESDLNPLMVFPNPINQNEKLTIVGESIETIKMYSILGQLVFEEYYEKTEKVEIGKISLQQGLYMLKVNGRLMHKLVVN